MSSSFGATIVVIAKSPIAGRAKTRLCPPCSPEQASRLARSALEDTLEAVGRARAVRRVAALEGPAGPWLPEKFDVIDQRGRDLGERIGNVFAELEGPVLLIGMDTPQLTASGLEEAVSRLISPGCDAVLGPTADGGYWGIGLKHPDPAALSGVPMSSERTFLAQNARLVELGLETEVLGPMRDVDEFSDALAVARLAPRTRFGRAVESLAPALASPA